jgi:hypothetical protein
MIADQVTVAFQGEYGAFSESAVRRILGTEVTLRPCETFDDMFDAVRSSDADCCVAPIENSLAGSIHRNYDLMIDSGLSIFGEAGECPADLLASGGACAMPAVLSRQSGHRGHPYSRHRRGRAPSAGTAAAR